MFVLKESGTNMTVNNFCIGSLQEKNIIMLSARRALPLSC